MSSHAAEAAPAYNMSPVTGPITELGWAVTQAAVSMVEENEAGRVPGLQYTQIREPGSSDPNKYISVVQETHELAVPTPALVGGATIVSFAVERDWLNLNDYVHQREPVSWSTRVELDLGSEHQDGSPDSRYEVVLSSDLVYGEGLNSLASHFPHSGHQHPLSAPGLTADLRTRDQGEATGAQARPRPLSPSVFVAAFAVAEMLGIGGAMTPNYEQASDYIRTLTLGDLSTAQKAAERAITMFGFRGVPADRLRALVDSN